MGIHFNKQGSPYNMIKPKPAGPPGPPSSASGAPAPGSGDGMPIGKSQPPSPGGAIEIPGGVIIPGAQPAKRLDISG